MTNLRTAWTRLALAAVLATAASGAALANSIAVPNGNAQPGNPCGAGNTNSHRYSQNCGALVTITAADTTSAYVQDNSPAAEQNYRARMYVNLQKLTMSDGDKFDLFAAYDGADPTPPAAAGNAVIRLEVTQAGGIKQLIAHMRTEGGGDIDNSASPAELVPGYRDIEINWSSGNPGKLDLFLDGYACDGVDHRAHGASQAAAGTAACTSLSGDNHNERVNVVRWGAVAGLEGSTFGSFKMDDFGSQRSGKVGPAFPFTDNPTSSANNFKAITGLYAAGVTSGNTVTTYGGANSIIRSQMAVFMVRSKHGSDFTPPAASGFFTDLPGDFTNPFIDQMRVDGITNGCASSPNRYCPGGTVSRRQMAVFLLKAEHGGTYVPPPCSTATFLDVACGDQFADYIYQLKNEGVTLGSTACGAGSRYCPNDSVTRAQMALFIVRTFACPNGASDDSTLVPTNRCMPAPIDGPTN